MLLSRFRNFAAVLCFALLIGTSFVSNAVGSIAVSVTNQGSFGFNGNWTLGYEFTANQDMQISHLGFFDRDQNGLAQSHDVGIWDSAGNLIVTTSVGNGDPLVGFFRYASVPTTMLSQGQNYIIGAYDFTPDDAIRSDLGGVSVNVNPDISIVTGRWQSGGSLQFPTNTINSAIYYPVASFQYEVVPESTEISWILLGCFVVTTRKRFSLA